MDMIVKSESLSSVANAIREKGKTTEQLAFPDGFTAAIMAIQSGGVSPQLIITAQAGSTITAVNGDDTVTGVIGAEGALTLDLPAFGEWTVTATLGENEASASVNVVQDYSVELAYTTVFTVNGGCNETVTISEGETTLASVTLGSTGTGTVVVKNVRNKTLVFTGSDSGYAKTVYVGNVDNETVNVFPDGAIFWHGRQFADVTGGIGGNGYDIVGTSAFIRREPSIGENITMKATRNANTTNEKMFAGTQNKIDFTHFDTLHCTMSRNNCTSGGNTRFAVFDSKTLNHEPFQSIASAIVNGGQLNFSVPLNGIDSGYVCIAWLTTGAWSGLDSTCTIDLVIEKIWLE